MAAPTTISQWFRNLPIAWLTGNTVGQADADAQGQVFDEQVDLIKQAVEARFPDTTPTDGLPHVGADRGLIQGFNESNDTFRARCKAAWDQWALAGTWAELLYQLHFTCGLAAGSAVIVQQNGLAYSLTGTPEPTDDPTTLLQIDDLGDSYRITYPDPVPWWTFDDEHEKCARFALIVQSPIPGSICITARATFDGTTDTVTADWSWPFDSAAYLTMQSVTTTDGSSPVVVVSAQDAATVTVTASAPFEGYVDLIGWTTGSNPFASPSLSTQNLISLICNRWKPAKATFMGTYVLATGWMLGWPLVSLGDAGLTLGDSLVTFLEP